MAVDQLGRERLMIRRLALPLLLALALALPARAASLLAPVTVTTAISPAATTPWLQVRTVEQLRNLVVQATFTYGSGGTTVDAYVQTSLDGGATAIDIANFHFTTASLRKAFNLSALTPVTTQATPTDGSLSANTAVDGLLGPLFRVKYQSSGTYAGGTTVRVDVSGPRLTPQVQ